MIEPEESSAARTRHNRQAPWWAGALIVLGATGLATVVVDLGEFWSSYVLDITGPAWNYILIRGRFTEYAENAWTRLFTPGRTVVLFIAVLVGIEFAQYLDLYDATFDPWDFLAYGSVLVPLYIVDIRSR